MSKMRLSLEVVLWTCCLCCILSSAAALSSNDSNHVLFQKSRPEVLNLLNHPLQLQLATGDLQLGAFQQLVLDRTAILEGLKVAVPAVEEDIALHERQAAQWLAAAAEAGKTIAVPGAECYNCGGDHLNIDCPQDQEISSSAQALKSLLMSNGVSGATAVLQCYGFSCQTLLKACQVQEDLALDPVYHGWLTCHAERWTQLGEICAEQLPPATEHQDGYTACLSMLYNWIDAQAATTGIRADLNDPTLATLMEELERREPGYAAQRDKHQSFVADLTGTKTGQARKAQAQSKVDKAAAYLASRKKKNTKLEAAAAYLAAKKQQQQSQEGEQH